MEFEDKTLMFDIRDLQNITEPKKRTASFIALAGSQAGRMHKLSHAEMIIGRVSDADIRFEGYGVSRHHAKVDIQPDGSIVITDLDSTNGTFCNGQKITTHTLQEGDKVQIGTTILKFTFQDSVEEDFQRRQYELATRDSLTGCFNKKSFLEHLSSEFAYATRHNKALSLAMIDIDHFKNINDTYGHLAGDYVLRNVANLMQVTVRTEDTLARYGGEEFAVIMRETPADQGFIAAERIRHRIELEKFNTFEGKQITVTISAGIATCEGGEPRTAEALVQAADELLYQAKRNGRNRTESKSQD
jgi:diguanylate cyclase (GGDEF)-like protein